VSQIRFTGAKMMEFKVGMQVKHEKHGEVKILNADGHFLVQVETLDGGDTFYTTRASFRQVKKKKATKPRAKKPKRVQKVDKLMVSIPARDEVEPEVFDELESVSPESEEETDDATVEVDREEVWAA
jgi:hypothetical protein